MTTFKVEQAGSTASARRLLATQKLTPHDFRAIAAEIGTAPVCARKTGFVSARAADRRETITTRWNGTESTIVAEPGDWIVANMDKDRALLRDASGEANIYAIKPAKFAELYEADEGSTAFGSVYRARSQVEALFFPNGFEIVAPWGDIQRANAGYLLLSGDDVYGNHEDTFDATYERVA